MGTETDKAEEEIENLIEFFKVNKISDYVSIEKMNPPVTPDLRCVVSENVRYFELSRMSSQDLSKHVSNLYSNAIWLDDQVERVLDKKLSREYQVNERIDLIFYDVGLIALPPEVVVAKLNHAMKTRDSHPFTEIWYLADNQATRINNER